MKIPYLIVRSLMGLLLLFASLTYWLNLITPPELTDPMKTFNEGIEASRYILPTTKVIELFCGIAFLSGRFVPLAAVLISPVLVNIFFINVLLDSTALPIACFLVLGNSWVAYVHRESFKPLMKM